MTRTVCVVTGSRAEYGLLLPLLKGIAADTRLTLQLAVTGMHLSPEFGLTVRQIEADGFTPDARVDMLLASDTPAGVAKSLGLGVIGFADALDRLRPDLLVVLGDRFEILAAAQAAMILRIPIAHIHGGELTEGLIDEAIRHSLTKMSHLHFTAAEPYRQRVIQLGEAPERVWTVGAPGLDAIRLTPRLSRAELSESLGFDLAAPYFLVTYHPVTLDAAGGGIAPLLAALAEFPGHRILFTGVNADPDNAPIREAISAFAAACPGRVHAAVSLGQKRYLGALAHADAVIGNSSSGILEAPSFRIPTVNIGDRQRGRLRAASVIDAGEDAATIASAIRHALSADFRAGLVDMQSPFGDGHASERMLETIATHPLEGLLMKRFQDMPS
ncbi:UDP-N-acetylglucosamine 2-epimerase [Oleispirillum naphthae]|uniref:UDP-N-acetylglucosamine 2-epimerase n=1 Tax=Oleispirillum naphthae TaxID=2838853 RepID=UPI0030823819